MSNEKKNHRQTVKYPASIAEMTDTGRSGIYLKNRQEGNVQVCSGACI
jgi:hypothetical protein